MASGRQGSHAAERGGAETAGIGARERASGAEIGRRVQHVIALVRAADDEQYVVMFM